MTPGTVRQRRLADVHRASGQPSGSVPTAATTATADSDEDATFNEMMGKFDESYCYEKETDILR